MRIPFTLQENGYRADPADPKRFISNRGHPFYPVAYVGDSHRNAGEHVKDMLEAAHAAGLDAGKAYGVGFAAAEIIRQSGDVESARGLLRVWSVKPEQLDPNDAATLREHGLIPGEQVNGLFVETKIGFDASADPEIAAVFANDSARTFWLLWKQGHITSPDFHKIALNAGQRIEKNKPKTAEDCLQCLAGISGREVTWTDLTEFIPRAWPFLSGERKATFTLKKKAA